jgi:hypothetical protein
MQVRDAVDLLFRTPKYRRAVYRIVLVGLAVWVTSCSGAWGWSEPPGEAWIVSLPERTDGVVQISSTYGGPKGPLPACPRPSEWELLTWPELELVATTRTEPTDAGGLCTYRMTPTAALSDRWYAVHWTRTELRANARARQLLDGTWLWLFRAPTHAHVDRVELLEIESASLVQAHLTEEIELAPGTTWATLMSVTQPDASCTYPGASVTIGHGTIGFEGIPVVECVRVDWNLPVHVHIEGALTAAAPHAPVPIVDVDVTLGATGSATLDAIETPPECSDPRCR